MGSLQALGRESVQHEASSADRRRAIADPPSVVPHHPFHVKPSGNLYTASANLKDKAGSFSLLPDELLVQVLEALDTGSLCNIGQTCKVLYAFSRLDDIWKILFVL